MSQDRKLFEFLKTFAVFAGKLALPYYGKIETKYKTIQIAERLHESPVTVIDHAIQELLLAEMVRRGFTNVAFNGEEDTHLKFFFRTDYENGVTLHCDPIDGTAAFIKGNGKFCTGFGLSRARNGVHEFFGTAIYSPLDKKKYWSFESTSNMKKTSADFPKLINGKRLFNLSGVKKLESMGYSFGSWDSAHLSILDVALRKRAAFIAGSINVHDALVPFSYAKNAGIIITDELGNNLKKFNLKSEKGKLAQVAKIGYFGSKEVRDDLLSILANPKYLH